MSEEKKKQKVEVIFAPKATKNLEQIEDYIADQGDNKIAEQVIDEIVDACEKLADFPRVGKVRDEILPGVRSVTSGSYVIYYRVVDEKVEILRVWHGARDLGALIADLD